MKAKVFFLLLTIMLTCFSCSTDDDREDAVTSSSIPAFWGVTDINYGDGWQQCHKGNYLETSWIVLTEDNFFHIMGQVSKYFSRGIGKYRMEEQTVICYTDSCADVAKIIFTKIMGNISLASITVGSEIKIDVKMERDETRPFYYKEVHKFLKGTWIVAESDDIPVIFKDAFIVFQGDTAEVHLKDEIIKEPFFRVYVHEAVIGSLKSFRFTITATPSVDEICIGHYKTGESAYFKKTVIH